jgi:hypothetical protein
VRNLRVGWVVLGVGLLVGVAGVIAQEKAEKKEKPERPKVTNPGFEKLKSLAGEWVMAKESRESGKEEQHEKMEPKAGEQVAIVFKVVSAGSAVMEDMLPGTPHEMITMYHMDGPDLVLTHYCALGNQPRMKAEKSDDPNKIVFKFAGGTNMDPAKDPHMHDLTWTFIDADHIRSEWTYFEDGKKSDVTVFDLTRKK